VPVPLSAGVLLGVLKRYFAGCLSQNHLAEGSGPIFLAASEESGLSPALGGAQNRAKLPAVLRAAAAAHHLISRSFRHAMRAISDSFAPNMWDPGSARKTAPEGKILRGNGLRGRAASQLRKSPLQNSLNLGRQACSAYSASCTSCKTRAGVEDHGPKT
jgi:hypothetical protein